MHQLITLIRTSYHPGKAHGIRLWCEYFWNEEKKEDISIEKNFNESIFWWRKNEKIFTIWKNIFCSYLNTDNKVYQIIWTFCHLLFFISCFLSIKILSLDFFYQHRVDSSATATDSSNGLIGPFHSDFESFWHNSQHLFSRGTFLK